MRSYAGLPRVRTAWALALCIAWWSGAGPVQASPQSGVPAPSQFQSMVPDNATIQHSRNVSDTWNGREWELTSYTATRATPKGQ
jgi:hypothetical protein